MKTFIILLLSAMLAVGALMSRPSVEDFGAYAAKVNAPALASNGGGGAGAYRDCYLWATVEKDGKTQYVGLFSHWFSRDQFSRGG